MKHQLSVLKTKYASVNEALMMIRGVYEHYPLEYKLEPEVKISLDGEKKVIEVTGFNGHSGQTWNPEKDVWETQRVFRLEFHMGAPFYEYGDEYDLKSAMSCFSRKCTKNQSLSEWDWTCMFENVQLPARFKHFEKAVNSWFDAGCPPVAEMTYRFMSFMGVKLCDLTYKGVKFGFISLVKNGFNINESDTQTYTYTETPGYGSLIVPDSKYRKPSPEGMTFKDYNGFYPIPPEKTDYWVKFTQRLSELSGE